MQERCSCCGCSGCSGPARAAACGRASWPESSNDKPPLRPPLTPSPPPRPPPSKEDRVRWAACRDERVCRRQLLELKRLAAESRERAANAVARRSAACETRLLASAADGAGLLGDGQRVGGSARAGSQAAHVHRPAGLTLVDAYRRGLGRAPLGIPAGGVRWPGIADRLFGWDAHAALCIVRPRIAAAATCWAERRRARRGAAGVVTYAARAFVRRRRAERAVATWRCKARALRRAAVLVRCLSWPRQRWASP